MKLWGQELIVSANGCYPAVIKFNKWLQKAHLALPPWLSKFYERQNNCCCKSGRRQSYCQALERSVSQIALQNFLSVVRGKLRSIKILSLLIGIALNNWGLLHPCFLWGGLHTGLALVPECSFCYRWGEIVNFPHGVVNFPHSETIKGLMVIFPAREKASKAKLYS